MPTTVEHGGKLSHLKNPYISIIIASRNDDYAGGILKRMQMTLPFLIQQLNSYEIESEILLVDWNCPLDKPKIKDALIWPNSNRFCTIRVIEVPSIYHQRYENWQDRPMHAAAAVNVGIRRARGAFCLNKVNDSFWSEELVKFISEKQLATDILYRCDRVDIDSGVLSFGWVGHNVFPIINYCQNNIIKIHNLQHNAASLSRIPNLHTNACGDFQLMALQNWHLLRGYLDRSVYSYKVDGFLSSCAYAAGIKEVCLDDSMRTYKIAHSNLHGARVIYHPSLIEKILNRLPLKSYIDINIKNRILFAVSALGLGGRVVIGSLSFSEYREYTNPVEEIVTGKRSYVLNGHNWGLGDVELPEFCLHKAEWE